MNHNLNRSPMVFTRGLKPYVCECGLSFGTYREWEKHKTAERRKTKSLTPKT